MGGRTEVMTMDVALPVMRGSALKALPARQVRWVTAQLIAAVALTAMWSTHPEIAICLSLSAGVAALNWRKIWTFPLVASLVTAAGMAMSALELSPIIGAGLMAGAIAAWMVPEPTDWLDHLHAALGVVTGSSLGLWAATLMLPATAQPIVGVVLTAALVGLMGSAGLAPIALRFDHPTLPSRRAVRRALEPTFRPEVFQAFDLYRGSSKAAPDAPTRRGLCEVATWVFRLQKARQTLERELGQINPERIQARISATEDEATTDPFTQERLQATAGHLRRLLDHRKVIELEWKRNHALVDYAVAFLEEARAGLAIAREMPGEAIPDRLPEVLERLRSHAVTGDARRRTAREMGQISP